MKKKLNLAFIFFILIFLVLSVLKVFFRPITNNQIENRRAYKFEGFSINKYMDQSLQNNLKNVLSDQVIGAMRMKSVYRELEYKNVNIYWQMLKQRLSENYVNYKGVYFYKEKHLMYKPIDFEENKEKLVKRLHDINKLSYNHKNVKFYTYLIENDNLNDYENNTKLPFYDTLSKELDSEIKVGSYKNNTFDDFKYSFFKTDHHWTMDGIYKSYKELLGFLDVNDKPFPFGEKVLLTDSFRGSKSMKLASNTDFKDDFYIYDFNFPKRTIISDGRKADHYSLLDSKDRDKIKRINYGTIFGDDLAELIIKGGKKDGGKILVIGNSYDNGLMDLLSTNFEELYSVDLRHYQRVFEKKFDIDSYIEDKEIEKVLFIGNSYFYFLDNFIFYD